MKSLISISKLAGRITSVLLGGAALVGIGTVWNAARYNGLLVFYALVLMAPLGVCLCWRLTSLWQLGFQRLPPRPARRAYLWTAAAFVSLTVLVYSVESWRGRRAYAALKQEVESKGGSLEFAFVVPPSVPDEANMCATPLLQALVDYEPNVPSPPFNREHLRWRQPGIMERMKEIQVPFWDKDWSRIWLKSEFTDLRAWANWFTNKPSWGIQLPTNPPAETVLKALSCLEPELNELRVASQRPEARWPLRYEDGFFLQIGTYDREVSIGNFIGILVMRSVAELELGQTEAALADWGVAVRLAQSTRGEPSFFTHLGRLRELVHLLQPVWEGLAHQRWTEDQLRDIDRHLSRIDLPSDWTRAVRGEVYFYMDLTRQAPEMFSPKTVFHFQDSFWKDGMGPVFLLGWLAYPRGWAYENQVVIYRLYETQAAGKPMWCPASTPRATIHSSPRKPIDPLLVMMLLPRLRQILWDTSPFCFAQFAVQSARVACALERYRLAHREYPSKLGVLVPEYLDELPLTPGTQDPLLTYRRVAEGDFVLHPVQDLEGFFWHGRFRDAEPVWRYSGEGP